MSRNDQRSYNLLRHPVGSTFLVPLRRHLLRLRPELDGASAGYVADAKFGVVPSAKGEWLARHGHADVHSHHSSACVLHDVASGSSALSKYRCRISVRRRVLHLEGFVDVLRPNDHQHGAKDLLLRYAHVGRDVIDYRRADEIALLLR